MKKLVIFDCDGVLVDSEPAANSVLIDNLAGYGLQVTQDECEKLFVGGTMQGVYQTARNMGADLPEDWVQRIYAKIYARLAEGVAPIDGIVALLDRIDAAGLAFCVASNGSLEKMRITLGQNGLWDRFEGRRFSAHTEGFAKPDPGLFLAAAAHFGATPCECLVIEDSRNGALAAARAGMRCLGYAPGGDGAHLAELGASVIHSMADVPAILGL